LISDTVLQLVAIALEPEACFPAFKIREDDDSIEDIYALTSQHASQKALILLRRWLQQPGPSRILASLPRRTDVTYAPAKKRYSFLDDAPDQLKLLQIMAKRVALSEDVWQLLSKGLEDQDKPRAIRIDQLANKPGFELSDTSWALLKLLVEAWQLESDICVNGKVIGFDAFLHGVKALLMMFLAQI